MAVVGRELGSSTAFRDSMLPRRLWRFLLAHDLKAPMCRPLVAKVEKALGLVDVVSASSVDEAVEELSEGNFDACFVCLNLPPVPNGTARLAGKMISEGFPVVLVTRSLRWLPPNATHLRGVPWISPDAAPHEVLRVMKTAMSDVDFTSQAI